jgi:hypothetical protein
MNYTGFGTDPNLIYSFRGAPTPSERIGGLGEMEASRLRELKSSLAYTQAGREGKARMESAVSMGLPANTDINKIKQTGFDPITQRSIFFAPRPQPFGTFSYTEPSKEEPSALPSTSKKITQDRNLERSTQFSKTELGTSGNPLDFTGFGQMAREQRASEFQTTVGRGMTGIEATVGVPRFPFAGAESSFKPATEASTFGGLPMFPSSRFGGPQPAQATGPVEIQPRRSWMY